MLLSSGSIERPVDVIRLLAKHGLSLKRARSVIDQLATGEEVAVDLRADVPEVLVSDLSRLGVTARHFWT